MRILYLDAFSGLSGDMIVGGLLALGVSLERLKSQLETLPLHGYRLRVSEKLVHGIRAQKFDVELEEAHHGHEHRPVREIRSMLAQSGLAVTVKERALTIFGRLAEAEGRVHGVDPDDVELHEVGAVDSIVDVVSAAIGISELGVESVHVSRLPLGSGITSSQHGPIPIPAPATLELLKGYPVQIGDGEGELTTPTGAAIVAALATPDERPPSMHIEAVGYGAGTRTLPDRPNVLRLVLGTRRAEPARDEVVVIETNIDDSSPEIYEHVMELLFAAGARDVWLTPVLMKKSRPGTVVQVIAEPTSRDLLAGILLRETSAIGVRFRPAERLVLPRDTITVETELGPIPVKVARAPDGTPNLAPEYEACKRVARERGVPLKLVYQAALAAARSMAG